MCKMTEQSKGGNLLKSKFFTWPSGPVLTLHTQYRKGIFSKLIFTMQATV